MLSSSHGARARSTLPQDSSAARLGRRHARCNGSRRCFDTHFPSALGRAALLRRRVPRSRAPVPQPRTGADGAALARRRAARAERALLPQRADAVAARLRVRHPERRRNRDRGPRRRQPRIALARGARRRRTRAWLEGGVACAHELPVLGRHTCPAATGARPLRRLEPRGPRMAGPPSRGHDRLRVGARELGGDPTPGPSSVRRADCGLHPGLAGASGLRQARDRDSRRPVERAGRGGLRPRERSPGGARPGRRARWRAADRCTSTASRSPRTGCTAIACR